MTLPPYDEDGVLALVAGLGGGDAARDAETEDLLRRILEEPGGSGLSAETLEKMRRAIAGPG